MFTLLYIIQEPV